MDPGVAIARSNDIPDTHGLLLLDSEAGAIAPPTFDFTLDTSRRARLNAVRFVLTTQAGAAARRARLEILQGTTVLTSLNCNATQAAFQARTYNFAPKLRDSTAFVQNELQTPLPEQLYIAPGFTLRITITGAPATDELSNIEITTENWIDG